jgi:hypothetical protein
MDLEVREQIAQYLAGKIDPAQLEDRLEDVVWDGDSEMAATVLRLLHEFAHGDWTEDELRQWLDPFARTYRVSSPALPNRTGTVAETMREDRQLATVETLRVAVSA